MTNCINGISGVIAGSKAVNGQRFNPSAKKELNADRKSYLTPSFFLQLGRRCCVLKNNPFIGRNILLGSLCHESRFMEARKNEFQLARIGIDVADCINTGFRCFEFLRININQVFIQIEAPVCYRSKFHRQAKKTAINDRLSHW